MKEVVKAGGEGLMLHRADAPLRNRPQRHLLKMKPWDDAEAVVIGYLPGKGRHAGRMGALRVRAEDGRGIFAGRRLHRPATPRPPPLGTTVTYRYHDLTRRGCHASPVSCGCGRMTGNWRNAAVDLHRRCANYGFVFLLPSADTAAHDVMAAAEEDRFQPDATLAMAQIASQENGRARRS